MDELTHRGTEGGHFGFPASDEALIESSNIGVILGRMTLPEALRPLQEHKDALR